MWLFLAFIAVPLIEITLFIQVGGAIGLGWTLAIVVSTAIIGTYLMRAQGALALGQIKSSLSEVRDPTEPLVHGAMILFAGALLRCNCLGDGGPWAQSPGTTPDPQATGCPGAPGPGPHAYVAVVPRNR